MQGFLRAVVTKNLRRFDTWRTQELIKMFSDQRHFKFSPPKLHDNSEKLPGIALKALQNTTVAEVLMTKGEDSAGSWLWCRTNDTVYDAVKQMAQNNIGSLVVIKPGEQQIIAGIITEKDYLRKIIMQDRSSKHTKVAEIMTDKLITVTTDTNILHAMRLMAENHIRHAPVIDGKIMGMISFTDVVRAVLEQQHGEVKQLNEFIQGYY